MSRRSGMLPKFGFKSAMLTIIVIIVLVLIAYAAGKLSAPKATIIDTRSSVPEVKSQQTINKTFDFSVKDEKGIEITKIKLVFESADLQDQLILQGQKASAIKGKTFLIINFSLSNSSNKYIQLNSRDYVRLVGNNGEMIAPDIHNDPIQIQPISTKESRLGFPVDDTIKNFTFSVGEIDGKKTKVTLSF